MAQKEDNEMKLYIIRGLPGTGKTTLAHELGVYVYEADDYFLKDGEYIFDITKLADAHNFCKRNVELAMESQLGPIAVANTFTRQWEIDPYRALANKYKYEVTEITLSGKIHGNLHNVPVQSILAMHKRWEV
jgi:hypothetical protein